MPEPGVGWGWSRFWQLCHPTFPLAPSDFQTYRHPLHTVLIYILWAQARAVENGVFLVKSNAAGVRCGGAGGEVEENDGSSPHPNAGSHGGSCIIDPTGIVLAEAGLWEEDVVLGQVDLALATACYAKKCLLPNFALKSLWKEAIEKVSVVR